LYRPKTSYYEILGVPSMISFFTAIFGSRSPQRSLFTYGECTVILLGLAVAVGFVIRVVQRGPKPVVRFRWIALLGGAAAVQMFVVPNVQGLARPLLLAVTITAAVTWLIGNLKSAASPTVRVALCGIALGAALNAAPIIKYGSMPVQRGALHAIGYQESDNTGERGAKHVIVDHAPFLCDRFALPPLHSVASLGDFVELAAIALLVSTIPHRRRRPSTITVNA
jgi:Family of unknown function (DUF5317)